MSAEHNETVVRRYIEEVWNRHSLDAIDGLVWPDYFNHAASTEEYRRGGARRSVGWLLSVFPDHRFDIEDAVRASFSFAGSCNSRPCEHCVGECECETGKDTVREGRRTGEHSRRGTSC